MQGATPVSTSYGQIDFLLHSYFYHIYYVFIEIPLGTPRFTFHFNPPFSIISP